jgi:hypothetical protein
MDTNQILAEIDSEIRRLEEAKALLAGTSTTKAVRPGTRKKRTLSTEARARIAEAQRKRWAKQKKAVK